MIEVSLLHSQSVALKLANLLSLCFAAMHAFWHICLSSLPPSILALASAALLSHHITIGIKSWFRTLKTIVYRHHFLIAIAHRYRTLSAR